MEKKNKKYVDQVNELVKEIFTAENKIAGLEIGTAYEIALQLQKQIDTRTKDETLMDSLMEIKDLALKMIEEMKPKKEDEQHYPPGTPGSIYSPDFINGNKHGENCKNVLTACPHCLNDYDDYSESKENDLSYIDWAKKIKFAPLQ